MRLVLYRTIDAAFWTDPKVRKLDKDGRYLLLYLITNPHTHVSGLYYIPPLIMQHETGMTVRTLNTLFTALHSMSLSILDAPNELVWVVNMFKFQGSGQKNTLSAAHHIKKDIHSSPLIQLFIQKYPSVKDALTKIGYSVRATPDPGFRIPDSGFRRTENGEEKPMVPGGTAGGEKYSPDFEAFWKSSTRRGSKVDAYAIWRKLKPTPELQIQILDGMQNWKSSEQWLDETKQPHIHRWLKRQGWEELVPASNGNGRPKSRDYSIAAIESHDHHRCSVCQVEHDWPCSDPDCDLTDSVACPEFRSRLVRKVSV